MGTHISKVKSVDLDMWTPEQMEVSAHAPVTRIGIEFEKSIQKWGNKRANLYWEAHLKPGHIPPEQLVTLNSVYTPFLIQPMSTAK